MVRRLKRPPGLPSPGLLEEVLRLGERPFYLIGAAYEALVGTFVKVAPSHRMHAIIFDPLDRRALAALYSNAASVGDLVLALRAILARLERGALRMPGSGGVRWVDVNEEVG